MLLLIQFLTRQRLLMFHLQPLQPDLTSQGFEGLSECYTTIVPALHTVIILGSHNPFASLSSETLNVSRFASKLTNLLVNSIKVDITLGFPAGTSGKEPNCQCRRHKRHRFDPWIRKIPWRRAWQPTPVFWPRESHGPPGKPGGLQCIGSQRVGDD